MRFSCYAAIVICYIGFPMCCSHTVFAQVRQAVVGCDDIGCDDNGCVPCFRHRTCPKRCGCKVIHRHYHRAPCPPEEDQPRDAVPGIAPGVFVTPPQSGVIEGRSRGVELPGLSISLPELTLSLPRVRLRGLSFLSREARMVTDRSAAPYVANPYYAASMAAQRQAMALRQAQDQSRNAEQDENQDTRDAEKTCGSTNDATKDASRDELERRLQQLESCFDQQMKALNGCIDQLRELRTLPTHAGQIPPDYYRQSQNIQQPAEVSQNPPYNARKAYYIPENSSRGQVTQTQYQTVEPTPYPPRPQALRRLPSGSR